jgi:AGCS family alanine or glycine:cation symporter
MPIYDFFIYFNNNVLLIPSIILFLGTAIAISCKTRFIQLRGFIRFIRFIMYGMNQDRAIISDTNSIQTVSPFRALFTAMGTTMGMGNVVGPSIAIMLGGPGALFWLILYMFFGSAIKYVEVVLALKTRICTQEGYVFGGPMLYLQQVHPFLGYFYGIVMSCLFVVWSGFQANTMANICALETIPPYISGFFLAIIMLAAVRGGIERISAIASKLVPLMFCLYIIFALTIIISNPHALLAAFVLVGKAIFSPESVLGALGGITFLHAIRHGVYQGIFITEAGVGTSSIPHSLARTHNPEDQGILAACSTIADASLSLISGIIVLVTGVWKYGSVRSTLIYEAFKLHAPLFGDIVLLASIALLVITTIIGNSFNGMQNFTFLTNHRFLNPYILFSACTIFIGSLVPMPLILEMTNTVLACAAFMNLIGILIIVFYHKNQKLQMK